MVCWWVRSGKAMVWLNRIGSWVSGVVCLPRPSEARAQLQQLAPLTSSSARFFAPRDARLSIISTGLCERDAF